MHLSSFSVEKAKPRAKPYKLADGDGLHILINPNGSLALPSQRHAEDDWLWRVPGSLFGQKS